MKPVVYYETLDRAAWLMNLLRRDKDRFLVALKEEMGSEQIYLTRAGRSAVILSLRAAGLKREDEVLVPRFLSTCILHAVCQVAMPSLTFTDRTKAVLLYHHWGYPQNLKKIQPFIKGKNILLIEDCADSLWGFIDGQWIGTFGDAAIFSLAKNFEITYAGALRINRKDLLPMIQSQLDKPVSLRNKWASLAGEGAYAKFYSYPVDRRRDPDVQADLMRWYGTLLTYSSCATLSGKIPASTEEIHQIFTRRNKNFITLLENSRNREFMADGDDLQTMAPMCFPVLSSDETFLQKVDAWLKERNIFTGIYHFDVQRNMFDPFYKRCVPVPLHASLSENVFHDFVKHFKGDY